MKIFKKEKKVVNLIMSHIDKTQECVETAARVLSESAGGYTLRGCNEAKKVSTLEHEADILLRETRELMYSGAYLPLIRADIYRLMSTIDEIANKAEDSCDVCCLQQPKLAEMYRDDLTAILNITTTCFAEFKKAAEHYFDPKGDPDKIREHLNQVSELESEVDTVSRILIKRLFESESALPEKIHFQSLIEAVTIISDTVEDAADELDLLNVKGLV